MKILKNTWRESLFRQMLPRERPIQWGEPLIYRDLSTSPWKPMGVSKRSHFPLKVLSGI